MGRIYTKQHIIDLLVKCDVSKLYRQDCVNYSGKTSDTNEYYTEVISEWLIKHIALLKSINPLPRDRAYFVDGHDGVVNNEKSNRGEEIMAKRMKGKEYALIGKIIDYQIPLKDKNEGKIDLLSYDGTTARILELKAPGNIKESMLRCVLEGYTYLKSVDEKKLLAGLREKQEQFGIHLPTDCRLKSSPLVYLNGRQHDEMNNKHPNLQKLMQLLDVKPFYYDDDMNVSE